MALEDLGISDVSGVGTLGSAGLGDFSLPDNIISPVPPSSPDLSGVDFASLGGSGADALGATFSDASPSAGSGLAALSSGDLGSSPVTDLIQPSGSLGGGSDLGIPGDLSIEPPAGQENLSQDFSADLTKSAPAASPADSGGMSPLAKTALAAAPALGALAFNAARGPYEPPAEKQLTALASQQAGVAAQEWNMYQSGTVPAGVATRITASLMNNISKINQYYSQQKGGFNSTMRIQAIQDAQRKSILEYGQYLDMELKASLAASGAAGQFFARAAQIQLTADAAFTKALTDSVTALGKIAAVGFLGAKVNNTVTL